MEPRGSVITVTKLKLSLTIKRSVLKQLFKKKSNVHSIFHATQVMSIAEYEEKFTSLNEKGKVRENTTKLSAYIKDNRL